MGTEIKANFTRAQYLARECTHRQYYAQFVNESVKERVRRHIGLERLLASKDEHLNDIPLRAWDSMAGSVSNQTLRAAGDSFTIAGACCIHKEAARQIIEENSK